MNDFIFLVLWSGWCIGDFVVYMGMRTIYSYNERYSFPCVISMGKKEIVNSCWTCVVLLLLFCFSFLLLAQVLFFSLNKIRSKLYFF